MYVAIIAIALLVSVAAFAIGTAIAPRATRMLKQAISSPMQP